MKIELEFPYSADWRLGYLQEAKTGRKYIVLFNSNSDRTITSYARYLKAVSLKRYLLPEEEVDHADEDRTNDDLSNLQVMGGTSNRKKNNEHRKATRVPKHGTLTEYRYCKCDLCKAAKREYMQNYKKPA